MAEYKSIYTGEQIDAAIGKANTALQEELEPSFNASASKDITSQDITNWNNKAEASDIPDVSNFITKDVNNLTNYYKKTETYTQTEIDSKLSSVYKYRGTVTTYNDLPSTALTIGDVYNIEQADSTHGIKAGDDVAWNGLTWNVLAGTVDLSGYQTLIDSSHKLNADLVDDTSSTNKFTNATEKAFWNEKIMYDKIDSTQSNPVVLDTLNKGIYDILGEFPFYYKTKSTSNTESFTQNYGKTLYLVVFNTIGDIENYFEENPSATGKLFGYIYGIDKQGLYIRKTLSYKKDGTWQTSNFSNTIHYLTEENQNIIGIKTFLSIPKQNDTTAPTTNDQFTNKKYVDDSVSNAIIQYSTIPTASVDLLGKIIQYTGTTDSTYTNGHFYKCVSDEQATPTYNWEEINIQDTINGDGVTFIELRNNSTNPFVFEGKKGLYYINDVGSASFVYKTLTTQSSSTYNNFIPVSVFIITEYTQAENNQIFGYLMGYSNSSSYNGMITNISLKKTNSTNITFGSVSSTGYMSSKVITEEPQTIYGVKTFSDTPKVNSYTAPTQNTQLTAKKYVDDLPKSYTGYDATKTQVLKNINGVLTWVDE